MSESDIGDGGLPPGGAPGGQACDCGPCPACAEDRQVSSGCVLQLGHGSPHTCASGDHWIQASPQDTPKRKRCTGTCPTCNNQCRKDFMHLPPHWCGQHDF